MTDPNIPFSARGVLPRLRTRLFGERDVVADQMHDIARQGAGMARAAHACALALIILFSAGSLVALSGDALASILREWGAGRVDVPSAISVAVSTLLVLCMDVGMVYAASMLRLLNARRAPAREKRLHETVMVIVAFLEAATYAYMSARYEHPDNLMVWGLILARAGAAPLLSIYLSMARALPVLPRDILYQVELVTGIGVLREAVEIANDPDATLTKKLRMYNAAGVMLEQDRERLANLIEVVQFDEIAQPDPPQAALASAEPGPDFPTGGGTPEQVIEATSDDDTDSSESSPNLVALARRSEDARQVALRPVASRAVPSGRQPRRKSVPETVLEKTAFALLDEWLGSHSKPMSKAKFRDLMSINQTHARQLYSRWLLTQTATPQPVPLVEDVAQ